MEPDTMEATKKRWDAVVAAMRAMGIDADSPIHDLQVQRNPVPHTVKLDLTATAPEHVRDAIFFEILMSGWRMGEAMKAAAIRRELGMNT